MRFRTLGSLLTGHRAPSLIAPSASASEAVRRRSTSPGIASRLAACRGRPPGTAAA
jgi:hypothetical protein